MPWKKQKIEPCANCGLNAPVEVSKQGKQGRWGIFCGACDRGYVGSYFWTTLRAWNKAWRKMRKAMDAEQALKEKQNAKDSQTENH